MDLMSLLRYLFDHNQQVIGGLMVIILATAALLAMRMVAQEKSATAGGGSRNSHSGSSDLDLGAIESAFKRVLAAQGGAAVSATSSAASLSSSSSSGGGASASDISERDAKIQELAREIDRLTSELNARADGGGFGGTVNAASSGSMDAGQLEMLQSKISELEGKLTEYEIIEDDIADLSRYKEENSELRGELEALKSRLGGAETLSAAAPVEAAPNPFASLEEELAGLSTDGLSGGGAASGVTASPKSEAAAAPYGVPESAPSAPVVAEETIEVEIPAAVSAASKKSEADEATLKDFASSVEVQKAPAKVSASSDLNFAVAPASLGEGSSILDDSVDTEKMFEEVSMLAQSTETADDALDGTTDTDKLLAEVASLNVPIQSVNVQTPAAPAAALDESKFEDDLLAEFKDSNDGGQG